MPDEKERLLTLLERERHWCRNSEAQDADGAAVPYDHPAAVAWDITGAMCRLFGWPRARVLFGQLDRHIHGKRVQSRWPGTDVALGSMVALQEFNDRPATSFDMLRELLQSLPVWRGAETVVAEA